MTAARWVNILIPLFSVSLKSALSEAYAAMSKIEN